MNNKFALDTNLEKVYSCSLSVLSFPHQSSVQIVRKTFPSGSDAFGGDGGVDGISEFVEF